HRQEVKQVAPDAKPEGDLWRPGDAPSQVLEWAVAALAKAGTLSVIGVYPQTAKTFPIGEAMNRNIAVNMGNCNHRKYLCALVDIVRSGAVDPATVLTRTAPMTDALEAYRSFDRRSPGWLKVKLELSGMRAAAE
ncbi:MAG TPA: glutathione-dependent formaldehyde dehydrogenase, partial [Dongiaceae bacterium]|nr:glutathione-dependent formaldehyde dehydrogenase [Dongiaceae bacterium]